MQPAPCEVTTVVGCDLVTCVALSVSGVQLRTVTREIAAAEAHERSEVEPGVQKNTGGRPMKI
jgi:hypothetical protein